MPTLTLGGSAAKTLDVPANAARAFVLAALLVPASAVAAPLRSRISGRARRDARARRRALRSAGAASAGARSLPALGLHVRDLLHDATNQLASLAVKSRRDDPRSPPMLTTEPVANTESSGFGWRDDPIPPRPARSTRAPTSAPIRARRCSRPAMASSCSRAARAATATSSIIDHGGGVITRYAPPAPDRDEEGRTWSPPARASVRSARPAAPPARTSTSRSASTAAPSIRTPRSPSPSSSARSPKLGHLAAFALVARAPGAVRSDLQDREATAAKTTVAARACRRAEARTQVLVVTWPPARASLRR